MSPANALFLHGGPGFSCRAERALLGTGLPVLWWDQPTVGRQGIRGFADLLDAAMAQLQEAASANGGCVAVLASSFGAQLALRLAAIAPDQMSNLTLLGPVLDLPASFVTMAHVLSEKRFDGELAEALKTYEGLRTIEALWGLINACAVSPDWLPSLFGPHGRRAHDIVAELATQGPLVDGTTYQVVLDDFLRNVPQVVRLDFHKPIKVLQGRHDPYVRAALCHEAWRTLCPAAEVAVVDTGHFPHWELPAAAWLPGAQPSHPFG